MEIKELNALYHDIKSSLLEQPSESSQMVTEEDLIELVLSFNSIDRNQLPSFLETVGFKLLLMRKTKKSTIFRNVISIIQKVFQNESDDAIVWALYCFKSVVFHKPKSKLVLSVIQSYVFSMLSLFPNEIAMNALSVIEIWVWCSENARKIVFSEYGWEYFCSILNSVDSFNERYFIISCRILILYIDKYNNSIEFAIANEIFGAFNMLFPRILGSSLAVIVALSLIQSIIIQSNSFHLLLVHHNLDKVICDLLYDDNEDIVFHSLRIIYRLLLSGIEISPICLQQIISILSSNSNKIQHPAIECIIACIGSRPDTVEFFTTNGLLSHLLPIVHCGFFKSIQSSIVLINMVVQNSSSAVLKDLIECNFVDDLFLILQNGDIPIQVYILRIIHVLLIAEKQFGSTKTTMSLTQKTNRDFIEILLDNENQSISQLASVILNL